MPLRRAAAAASALALCAAVRPSAAAARGILERLVEPAAPEDFLASVYEQRWEYFPHNESLLPISLAQVSEWISAQGDGESVVETLPHPVTKRPYRPASPGKPGTGALERVQDAFLQGFSMVINSLHRWSEPGLRLALELYSATDLPVDVYMYLTPPHSSSYGLHNDVMDAWMVQLQGAKQWRLCERRVAPWPPQRDASQELNSSCSEVTMRGGDVLYLPFYTQHQATTADELSMHLTVNVERQYYVWATLLIAVLYKVVDPKLTVEQFVGSGSFRMEGESKLEMLLQRLMGAEPLLLRMPSAAGAVRASAALARPLCGVDLPDGYLEGVVEEFRSVAASVAAAVKQSKKLAKAVVPVADRSLPASDLAGLLLEELVPVADRSLPASDLAGLLLEERAAAAIPWTLEVARLHSVQHFGRDEPKRFLPTPELFSSLAAARATEAGAAQADRGAVVRGLGRALLPGTRLSRRSEARAVLLLEDRAAGSTAPAVLHLNSQRLEVSAEQLPLAQFCLGLFADGSARGRPFLAGGVPGGLEPARRLLQRLLAAGALSVLPPEP